MPPVLRSFLVASLGLAACAGPAASDDAGPPAVDAGPPPSIEEACRDGQTAIPGLPGQGPESVLAYWDSLDHTVYPAVLARRAGAPATAAPGISPPAIDDMRIAYCLESATHEVIDGLGWIDAASIEVQARTGQTYWSTVEGTPLPGVDWIHSDDFLDPDTQKLASDDATYLLILRREGGTYFLHRRTALVGGLVSGDGTTSGETAPTDAFRAP